MNTSSSIPKQGHGASQHNEKFELLLFRLGRPSDSDVSELFGINIFKVREIVVAPKITHMLNAPPHVVGLADVRGQMMPVIDLPSLVGCTKQTSTGILLITEFARTTQAFMVDEVVEIVQLEWKHLLAPGGSKTGVLSGIAQIDGDVPQSRLAQILDVEQILRDIFPETHDIGSEALDISKIRLPEGSLILFADDSHVARLMVEKSMNAMGVEFIAVNNGKEAWRQLERMHMEVVSKGLRAEDRVAVVLTDLEMPEMDGFTLTSKIKKDPRFQGIPVIIYSSLTGSASEGHANAVGADAYVAKFEPKELAESIRTTLQRKGWEV